MLKRFIPIAGMLLLAFVGKAQKPAASISDAPRYTASGDLIAPTHYREWIFLTSGIDMSYAAATSQPSAHPVFNNVFVNPTAYRSFLTTGTWPDKTTMVLEIRASENPVSINKRGHTQTSEITGFEIHVKDHGKWSFYDQDGNTPSAKLIPPPADCYSCHENHGAVDTTFVQFYPTLLPRAKQKNTLSPAYLKEMASPVASNSTK
jgi:hypothetical protein